MLRQQPPVRHLRWLLATLSVGFMAPFMFADVMALPRDVYYVLYFASVLGFAAYYANRTHLDIGELIGNHLTRAVVCGIVVGLFLIQGVLAHTETARLTGAGFWWALLWRGIGYGLVDGVLLFSLPWTITWRAFDADGAGVGRKVAAASTAWIAVLVVTTAYHLGYRDFRSSRIVQPNIGSAIGSLATLAAANPVASPIAHVFLHVAAVIHSPDTDLFLPPHRD